VESSRIPCSNEHVLYGLTFALDIWLQLYLVRLLVMSLMVAL